METLNKLFLITCLLFNCSIPLSIAQQKNDSLPQTIKLVNTSFENANADNLPTNWVSCPFLNESPLLIQPGKSGCTLTAQNGKQYIGMVANENNAFQTVSQVLTNPLKAGVCYRMSVYLAKSPIYEKISSKTGLTTNFNRPLKFVIWGLGAVSANVCKPNPSDWLTETLPVHNDGWRKYTFYIQPPKEVTVLVFSVNHVVEKPYNGNLLIDNISPIEPVSCTDLQRIHGGQKTAFLALQQVSDVIVTNAPKLVFGGNNKKLVFDTEGGHNAGFDRILAYFEKSENYKLVIRVKKGKELKKQRIAFMYSYIFKNTSLKAQRVEIKPFTPKDEAFFWTFENEELALSFDSM